jgi:prophage DNA circulation protein
MADEVYTFPTAVFVDGKLDKSSIQPPPPAPTGPQWKGPLLDEDWHATQASFGGVDFWVQRGSDSEPVRIGEYKRPYARGANLEAMGQDSRTTPVSALLVRSQVLELRKLRDSMVARTYRDPTLGSYTAMLVDVVPNWDATKLNFYQTELTFRRHGIQAIPKVSITPQSAHDAATARYTEIYDRLNPNAL